MYNLEQLRMFVVTAQSGSFSACARKLGKVQSAVSQGIANLEIELNTTLFDRCSRKPSLTPHGERLLPFAQAILQQTYELDSVTSALNSSHETQIKMAVDDALLPIIISILNDFATLFPATNIELCAVSTPDVLTLVHTGRADLGLMFASGDFPKEVDLCYVGSLPFNGVVSPEHPLAKMDIVTAADLIPHRQLLIRGMGGQELAHCPHISSHIWWGNSFNAVNTMVKEGLGWSYIPVHMAERYEHQGEMVRMNLSFDHKPWRVPIDRVMAKQKARGPAFMWLAEAVTCLLGE
ncbi:LysR family transcriptional regulator [Shewanella eurypsychrophilus]|uniref:LysR family transcriptional regulator n=1 Tax=Shewanella eurypsychrophilus TaxID=2593656 RepID=A0ABX6VAD2_9GAMM|nr:MULTISPECIES: LysR family transcriptional regulator [Shewanella]QFU24275.1 LysR family transcriptional regulator [Shewanella sp. YLB-09]QPG59477.1 LysR family transcriptional regulator [Shewanella eurypsychrophilus]